MQTRNIHVSKTRTNQEPGNMVRKWRGGVGGQKINSSLYTKGSQLIMLEIETSRSSHKHTL